jgi:FAD/FMN-containing dehydrogenase
MVTWRNHEASYDVAELEPASRNKSTFVLQEYFVPVARFDEFIPKMRAVFNKHKVKVFNVSIRHALPDPGSLLAWAPEEVFAFVVYYEQGTRPKDREEVGNWTREMISEVLRVNGLYYLPYQPHATDEQFRAAYKRSGEFFALKKRLDPENKFRNKLWDKYHPVIAEPIRQELEKKKSIEGLRSKPS